MENYYEILGLSSDASLEDIKKRYKELAKKYHPDINKRPDAHNIFVKINVAYEFLKDEENRKKYDEYLNNKKYKKEETKEDKAEFDRTFSKEHYYSKAEKYANMTFEQFSNVLDEISIAVEKTKEGIRIGCGFLVFVISGLYALGLLYGLLFTEWDSSFGTIRIVLFLFSSFICFGGWAYMKEK